jgi:membrane associated rhomboid family serine protease
MNKSAPGQYEENDSKEGILKAIWFPLIFTLILWAIKSMEYFFNLDFKTFGLYPLRPEGLIGIITSPLIHSDFNHLINNSLPLFLLLSAIFYFHRDIAWKVFFLVYILSGIWVWFGGRPSYHIGASNLVYGFASFLFLSGILRKHPRLIAISLLITFLYGSMVWGILPYELFPYKEDMSWEGHLWGLIAGIVAAVFYKDRGISRKDMEERLENTPDTVPEEIWNKQTEEKDLKEERKNDKKDPLDEFLND